MPKKKSISRTTCTMKEVAFTTSLHSIVLAKLKFTYTLIIVPGKTRTIFFLWYFARRTACKLHHSIKFSFLIAGNTKFGPDRCFGLLKKSYKVNFISSNYDLPGMVDASSNAAVNKA